MPEKECNCEKGIEGAEGKGQCPGCKEKGGCKKPSSEVADDLGSYLTGTSSHSSTGPGGGW